VLRYVVVDEVAQAAYVPSRLPDGLETGLYEVQLTGHYWRHHRQHLLPCMSSSCRMPRDRFVVDSALEETGFELVVPPRKKRL
jgi:hypothetical protein